MKKNTTSASTKQTRTISFTSTKRTIATVASFTNGTNILAALALRVLKADNKWEDEVSVTLDFDSIIAIYRLLDQQQHGLVAPLALELDELLSATIAQDPEGYAELIEAITNIKAEQQKNREKLAEIGLVMCQQSVSVLNLNI
jgi:hypothetical protein